MACDTRTNVARLSYEKSRDIFSKLDRNSRICRINVYSMRLQSCVCIVNLCREIVAKYLRTSLQLSHSSEIRGLKILEFSPTAIYYSCYCVLFIVRHPFYTACFICVYTYIFLY